ncbi:putative RNA-directed DNA polymerase [Tanacetum coccineum]|uniref:RNA-directed DNA polymerase n=1 Tax=Tanacetum coccineum TaxID=301880 RepID=A0ABQ5AXB0_9ASTR
MASKPSTTMSSLPLGVPANEYSTNNSANLGFSMLKNLAIPTSGSTYWINADALLCFVCLFNILFTVSLMYMQGTGSVEVERDKPPNNKGVSSGSEENNIDQYDPLYLHSNDINGVPIIGFKLEGTENYKVWKAAISIAIHTKNKLSFINGKIETPQEADVFMGQVFSKNDKTVWDELVETYSKQDASVIFNMHFKIHSFTQSSAPLFEYYHKFNALWRQYDSLGAFATLSRDESHRSTHSYSMIKSGNGNTAFVERPNNRSNNWSGSNNQPRRLNRPNLVCTHCNMNGHTADRCFELVGYPPNFKKNVGTNRGSASNNVVSGNKDHSNTFIDDQYKRLMFLISEKSGSAVCLQTLQDSVLRTQVGTGNESNGLYFLTIDDFTRTPGTVLSGRSPYEMIFKTEPNLSHLKVFGCLCFSTILNNNDKFSSRSEKSVFIGYSFDKKGYKLYSLETKKDFYLRGVKFYEAVFPFKNSSKNKEYELELKDLNGLNFFNSDLEEDLSDEPYDDRRDSKSKNSKGTDQFSHGGTERSDTVVMDEVGHLNKSISEEAACENLESEILDENISNFEGDDTAHQEKTSMPAKLSDFEVDTKVKYNIDRQVNYSKLSEENYNFSTNLNKISEPKTYSEAANDIKWIEVMNQEMEALNRNGTWVITDLPIGRKPIGAIHNSWPIYQLDINNAFFYGELEEDVYMTLPEGYFDKNDKRVCKLVKSLYGLKQAPRKWNEKLVSILLENGFLQNKNDFSLFTKNKNGIFIALLVYVDDIVITGNNNEEIKKVKEFLSSKFLIKDLGILGYKSIRVKRELVFDSKKVLFRGFGRVCQFMHAPLQSHLKLAFRVLRYLKNAPGKGISFVKSKDLNLSVAMNTVTCEDIWINKVLTELNVHVSLPVPIHCDNSYAIQIATNPIFHEKTKHFEIELFFLREKVSAGVVKIVKVKSIDNVADIFTKGLSVQDHNKFCDQLGLFDMYKS